MKKSTAKRFATLACIAYFLLFSAVYGLLEITYLGQFWRFLFLILPMYGLWRWITGLAEK